MFMAGLKVHEEIDLSDVRSSSVGIFQKVFFWPPAVFYAWTTQPLMNHQPSVARLLHRHETVPQKQHFQTVRFRTCSRRRPHPRQLSNSLLDNCRIWPRLGKSPHVHQVGAGETPSSQERPRASHAPAARSPRHPSPVGPAAPECHVRYASTAAPTSGLPPAWRAAWRCECGL